MLCVDILASNSHSPKGNLLSVDILASNLFSAPKGNNFIHHGAGSGQFWTDEQLARLPAHQIGFQCDWDVDKALPYGTAGQVWQVKGNNRFYCLQCINEDERWKAKSCHKENV